MKVICDECSGTGRDMSTIGYNVHTICPVCKGKGYIEFKYGLEKVKK